MENYKYLATTGVIVPDTSNIQTEVEAEYRAAFGEGLSVDPNTPQGVLIEAEVLARAELVRNNAQLANQNNPNESGGIFIDALCGLFGLMRSKGNKTLVPNVRLAGVEGTVVSDEFTVTIEATDGSALFSPVAEVTLNSAGLAFVDFLALVPGAVEVPVNKLNVIPAGSGILGLETVTNPTAGITGTNEQTDQNLKLQRNQTLGLQGQGFAEAIISRVNTVDGVTSVKFRENKTGATLVIDGVTMVQHSLYACVDGGLDSDVALGISSPKDGGCNYNNGPGTHVSVPVTNFFSGQTIDVLFDRPARIDVIVEVTVVATAAVTDPIVRVKQAVVDYANGLLDGEPGLKIGVPVSSFEIAGAVSREIPELYVKLVRTAKVVGGTLSSVEIPINIWERARVELSGVTVILA